MPDSFRSDFNVSNIRLTIMQIFFFFAKFPEIGNFDKRTCVVGACETRAHGIIN